MRCLRSRRLQATEWSPRVPVRSGVLRDISRIRYSRNQRKHRLNLTISLPDSDVRALEVKAKAQGMSAEQYALQVLERDLAPDWLRKSWSSADEAGLGQLSMDEIEAEIAAARRARRATDPRPGA